jgi:hypothetical protein
MNAKVKSILEHMLEDAEDVVTFSKTVGSLDKLRINYAKTPW